MPAKIKLGSAIVSDNVTQEQADRLVSIVQPMALVLLNLDPETRFHVMGSLLSSYGFSFTDPAKAVVQLAEDVLSTIPEALAQMGRKPQ